MVRKSAFTLIELVFAIVVIAISVISLPQMIQTSSDGIESNLVQEAIFIASTELNQAVAANWDENSLVETGSTSLARVIDNGSCENNSSSPHFRRKPGHITQEMHRRCLDSNTTGVSSVAVTDVEALEDYAGTKALVNAGGSQEGYKYSYSTNITVTTPANFNGNSADIKMIQANISEDGKPIASLRTYSANIGEVDYYSRSY